MSIMIQAPDGFKKKLLGFADNEKEKDVFISVEPCYGACDLRDNEAKRLNCDKLIHYGHNDFGLKTEVPVEYRAMRTDVDPIPVLKKNIAMFRDYKKIGFVATIQFLHLQDTIKEFFAKNNKELIVGFVDKKRGASAAGQILGCDVTAAQIIDSEVDCFLYIGTGRFHPTGMTTKKPFFVLDIEKNTVERSDIDHDKIERQRYARIAIAKTSDVFGILLSTKSGQCFRDIALKTRDKLQRNGKKAYILVADEFTPEKLMGLDVDCYVNCSCPRMTGDTKRFEKPVINPQDVENAD